MKESGNLPPQVELEQRASLYKIIPYGASREQIVLSYADEYGLRWSLNRDNFNIKLWPSKTAMHLEVDADDSGAGTTGYISQKRGITYSDSGVLKDKEKAALQYALKKYLTT